MKYSKIISIFIFLICLFSLILFVYTRNIGNLSHTIDIEGFDESNLITSNQSLSSSLVHGKIYFLQDKKYKLSSMSIFPTNLTHDNELSPVAIFRSDNLDTNIYSTVQLNLPSDIEHKKIIIRAYCNYISKRNEELAKLNLYSNKQGSYKEVGNFIIIIPSETLNFTFYNEYHIYQKDSNNVLNFYYLRKDFEVINNENTSKPINRINYVSTFYKLNNNQSLDLIDPLPTTYSNTDKIDLEIPQNINWVYNLGGNYSINTDENLRDDIVTWHVSKNKSLLNILKTYNKFSWSQGVHIETNINNIPTQIIEKNSISAGLIDNQNQNISYEYIININNGNINN